MTPEEKKAAEIDATLKAADAKKRADAEAKEAVPEKSPTDFAAALDALNAKLDAVCGRIESLGAKKDEEDTGMGAGESGKEPGEPKKVVADSAVRRMSLVDAQGRADAVACAFGSSAPRPMDGETIRAYRQRLLRPYQEYSQDYKDVDLNTVADGPLFDAVEKQIYADAVAASSRPNVPMGRLLERIRTDPVTGLRSTEFHGPQTFIHLMKRPPQRVTRFMTEKD